MHFIISRQGEDCLCPICNQLLLPGVEDPWEEDDDEDDDEDEADDDLDAESPEWDSSWLCRHVRVLDFDQADEHLFRTAELKAWWKSHAATDWEIPKGASVPTPEGWDEPLDQLDDTYAGIAACVAAERPDISHLLVAETDAGAGPAPAWIAVLAFAPDPWPDDNWA
jgi:hypothetical protein